MLQAVSRPPNNSPSSPIALTVSLAGPLTPAASSAEDLAPSGWRSWCGGRSVQWVKLAASAAVAGVSVFTRVAQFTAATNALSSIGIGIGAMSAVNTCAPNSAITRVNQIALTTCGQSTVWFLSYAWMNVPPLQVVAVGAIGVCVGVNLAVYGKYFIDKYINRIDSDPPRSKHATQFDPNFPTFYSPERFGNTHQAKGIATLLCGLGWLLSWKASSPILEGIFSFGTLFYATQNVGEYAASEVDKKIIRQRDAILGSANDEISQLPRSGWRSFKAFVNSVAPLAIPAIWVATAAGAPLWVAGLSGVFDGYLHRSQENRFKNKPIEELDELKPRTPEHTAFRVYQAVHFFLVQAGMAYIFIRELTSSTNGPVAKQAIGTMYAAFMVSTIRSLYTEWRWKLEERLQTAFPSFWDQIKDRMVIQQMLPRIFAMAPAYLYLMVINSIKMDSKVSNDLIHNFGYRFIYCLGWGAYGFGQGTELGQTGGNRIGIIHRVAMMALLNGILMSIQEIKGEV